MTFGRRPELSVIVYNKDDKDIENITQSLLNMDKLVKAKIEFVLVVYNKQLSKENMQKALRLRQFMPVRIIDYTEKHNEDDVAYYGRAHKYLVKTGDSKVTETQVVSYFNIPKKD